MPTATEKSPSNAAPSLATGVIVSSVIWTACLGGAAWWIAARDGSPLMAAGAAAAAGLLASLVAWRPVQARLRGVSAVQGALSDYGEREEREPDALKVDDRLGPEARAWNALIRDLAALRQSGSRQRLREVLESKAGLGAGVAEVLDALWDGVLIVNDRGEVEMANGASGVMLAQPREKLVGGRVAELLPEAASGPILSVLDQTGDPRPTVEWEQGETLSAGVILVSARLIPETGRALVLLRDVTQQRVADLTRNAFVTQATHELRTPLTNISLYTNMLVEQEEDLDGPQKSKCLNVIGQESRRLEGMIDDMLSVAEIEAGSLDLRRGDVEFRELLGKLQTEYQAQADEKTIKVRMDLPPKAPTIQGDRDKLVLVLHNLVGNAIKYTPEGGEVVVSMESDEQRITIDVHDTGIGISPQDLPNVFDKFFRANDPRLADIRGSGLGLSLAREVVRLHGGDITVDSTLNEGSTFRMVLPLERKAA